MVRRRERPLLCAAAAAALAAAPVTAFTSFEPAASGGVYPAGEKPSNRPYLVPTALPHGCGSDGTTPCGEITGYYDGRTLSYKGVKYGAPPTGDRRFAAPRPPSPWAEIQNTTSFGAPCLQVDGGVDAKFATVGQEDCLTLNVYRPTVYSVGVDTYGDDAPELSYDVVASGDLPVVVWVHGGDGRWGTAGSPWYDGAALADAQMVLVVTVNYRLGLFGAMAHPALDAESGGSGAWGAHDVVLALKWVQNNIAAFGGDPAKVTLMGQDTGADMVVQFMCAQPAQGLFSSAVALGSQSHGYRSKAYADQLGAEAVAALDCSLAAGQGDAALRACLRGAPAEAVLTVSEQLAEASPTLQHHMAVDGLLFTHRPYEALAAGAGTTCSRIPFFIGSEFDAANYYGYRSGLEKVEDSDMIKLGRAMVLMSPSAQLLDEHERMAGMEDVIKARARRMVNKYYARYGNSSDASQRDAYYNLWTHAKFACHAKRVAAFLAPYAPTYMMMFNRGNPSYQDSGWSFTKAWAPETGNGYHFSEISYLFGSPLWGKYELLPGDQRFVATSQNFVGNVSYGRVGGYNSYETIVLKPDTTNVPDVQQENFFSLPNPVKRRQNYEQERCEEWDDPLLKAPPPAAWRENELGFDQNPNDVVRPASEQCELDCIVECPLHCAKVSDGKEDREAKCNEECMEVCPVSCLERYDALFACLQTCADEDDDQEYWPCHHSCYPNDDGGVVIPFGAIVFFLYVGITILLMVLSGPFLWQLYKKYSSPNLKYIRNFEREENAGKK